MEQLYVTQYVSKTKEATRLLRWVFDTWEEGTDPISGRALTIEKCRLAESPDGESVILQVNMMMSMTLALWFAVYAGETLLAWNAVNQMKQYCLATMLVDCEQAWIDFHEQDSH